MKILVTGAMGQVGTELLMLAHKRNHNGIGFGERALDITDEQQVLRVIEEQSPDVVINAAAYTAVDKAETERDLAYKVNDRGVGYLAAACKRVAIPMLHISTDYVFDGSKDSDYVESDKPEPYSVYGASKLAGEKTLTKVLAEHLILRVSWVFGLRGQNFVKTMLKLAQNRHELSVVDDQFGAPTSAIAIARNLINICELEQFGQPDFPWGTYHLASNPGVTWYEFAQEIFSQAKETGLVNKPIKVNPISSEQFPTPVKRPKNSKLASEKHELLAFSPCNWKHDLRDMLKSLQQTRQSA